MTSQPEKIGKYEILDIAGRGNMGVVYVAHDPFADRKVAIKVCSMEDEEQSNQTGRIARKLFFNEAHTVGSLDHPNILSVYDAGEEDGQPYIVMEYVENAKTLNHYCVSSNFLPFLSVAEILLQAAKALDYSHRRGVIHRDIKPTNIMLDNNGRVKLGDFGIAQSATAEITQIMGVLGSPRYMSPEQAREDEVSSQTDLYSLGVVAYEMLAGQPPFTGQGFSRLMYSILNEPAAPIRTLRPEVPTRLAAIVDKCIEKDLGTRYANGRDIAADIAEAFDLARDASDDELTQDEKFTVARDLRFFNDLSDSQVWEVLRASLWETYAADNQIITEGNIDDSFYVIIQGDVIVSKGNREISALSKGDCFGEMGYLSKTNRSASIIAKDDVSLLKINASLMQKASMPCQLQFSRVFIQTLIERLTRTSEQLSR